MPIDYKLGKIYKLVNDMTDDVYIGSTCEPTLARRLANHISNFRSYKKGKGHYVSSFQIIENGNYDIQLIESYPCNSKDELHAREGHYIKTMACVNKVIVGRSKKEYYQQNCEIIKNRQKQYRELNSENIKIQQKQNYAQNKEQFKQYYQVNKESIRKRQKQYRELNSANIKIKQKQKYAQNKKQFKQYYQENKEHFKELRNNNKKRLQERHNCECGGHYKLPHKALHTKTTKHQQFIKLMDFVKSDKEFYNAYISLQKIKNREVKQLPKLF
jgi:hypothetical protein